MDAGETSIDTVSLGLLHNVAKFQPVHVDFALISSRPTFHETLAARGWLIRLAGDRFVLSAEGERVVAENPFPPR